MNYILDTHVLLWSQFDVKKLSNPVRDIILDRNRKKFISISSMWEISIKNRIGKLPLPNGISDIFNDIESNGFGLIGISRECIEIYNNLPLIHRDPFDGIIIATAILEQMTIITVDENIQKYDVTWIWSIKLSLCNLLGVNVIG
jgi:PIN domain nuclease of toxin-antitoxin system